MVDLLEFGVIFSDISGIGVSLGKPYKLRVARHTRMRILAEVVSHFEDVRGKSSKTLVVWYRSEEKIYELLCRLTPCYCD